jgi:perosamine synthetase
MTNYRQAYLPFHVPDIGEAEIESVVEVLRSKWLTTGPKVRDFEEQFRQYVGAKHCIAVNSCTAALHLALDALNLSEGDEVLVPTMTFAATAEVVCYFRARPVLVDCDLENLNMDPGTLSAKISRHTKAIIPVHYAGHPCQMDEILEIGRSHGIAIIEDAAHALPARYRGLAAGTIGDIGCFSFYVTKTLCTGEGGMIATCRGDYAQQVRIASLHGISTDAWKRYHEEGSWYYEILRPGFKYNMTDIAAALGIAQLAKCNQLRGLRESIAQFYNEAFSDLPEIVRPTTRAEVEHAWHLYPIRLVLERLRIDRDAFIRALQERKIGSSVHFIPLHLHPYYRSECGYRPEDLPVATDAYRRLISLPIFPGMTTQDLTDVVYAVRDIVTKYRK